MRRLRRSLSMEQLDSRVGLLAVAGILGRTFGYRNVDVVGGHDAHGRPVRSHVERQIKEEEAVVVRRIFDAYAGGLGFSAIAKTLNDERACRRAPSRDGRTDGAAPAFGRSSTARCTLAAWCGARLRSATSGTKSTSIANLLNAGTLSKPHIWRSSQRVNGTRYRPGWPTKGTSTADARRSAGRPPARKQHQVPAEWADALRAGRSDDGGTYEGARRLTRTLHGCSAYHRKGRTEAERAQLQQEIEAEQALTQLRASTPTALRASLRERLDDWRGLLRGQVTQAQQILRRLLAGPLTCVPQPGRCYRLTGTATLGRLVAGQLPRMVASPVGELEPARGLAASRRPSAAGGLTGARSTPLPELY